ncbi:MAG: peptidoglycan binding protein CsiV [Pseudomonadales bacterium]|nr:peptidoglycan binding protein CsiV [Pseudomonadales bacterium]
MNKPLATVCVCLPLSLLAGFISVTASAEVPPAIFPPSEEQPWYQVNIAIFKQPQHLLQSEQWKTGAEMEASFPNTTISLEIEGMETGDEAEHTTAVDVFNPTHATANLSKDSATHSANPQQASSEAVIPPAFQAQVSSDEEFNKVVNRLNRSPNYEILYQTAWLQPPLAKEDALAVLIQAGESYNGLYELEGTTSLHVARYLHLNTNIRLAKYVQQIEVIKPWWQGDEGAGFANAEMDNLNDGFTIELGQETMQLQNGVEQPIDEPGESNRSDEDGFTSVGNFTELNLEETVTRYQSIRTGVMDESRRMRSGELHYIDHPLFGMVVKVIPYFPAAEETTDATLAEGIVNP